jgi:hypothetical protein
VVSSLVGMVLVSQWIEYLVELMSWCLWLFGCFDFALRGSPGDIWEWLKKAIQIVQKSKWEWLLDLWVQLVADMHDELSYLLLEGIISERGDRDDVDSPVGAMYRYKLRRLLSWENTKIRSERLLKSLPSSMRRERALVSPSQVWTFKLLALSSLSILSGFLLT